MIIKINNKYGEKVAECSLIRDEFDCETLRLGHSFNCLNVTSGDVEQGEHGFDEVIEIDIDNLISPKKMQMIKSLAGAWATFETLRSEYELGCSDDDMYALEIIGIPHIYGFITDDEYKHYVEALNQFLGFDGDFYNNSEYDYSELDEFIQNLNPIYEK